MGDYKGLSKKQLRSEIAGLLTAYDDLSCENANLTLKWHRLREDNDRLTQKIGVLTRENERLTFAPEHKANVEAAYNRGFQAARRNLRAWAVTAVTDLEAKLEDGQETRNLPFEPEIFRTIS